MTKIVPVRRDGLVDVGMKKSKDGIVKVFLEDGTEFEIKTTISNFKRAEGAYDSIGQPLYVFNQDFVILNQKSPKSLWKTEELSPVVKKFEEKKGKDSMYG